MTALLPALALTFALGGCSATRPEPAEPVEPVSAEARPSLPDAAPADTVRVGLGASVTVEGVAVRFARVVEDSRCPPDVSCVWAGRAHVELVVGGAAHVLSVPGYGPDDQPSEATAGGLTVRVSALAGPAPTGRTDGEPLPMWVEIVAERAASGS